MTENNKNRRFGYACAIGAQVCWGCFPIYVHLLKSVEAWDFVAHRAIWSFLLLAFGLWLTRFFKHPILPSLDEFKATLQQPAIILASVIAAILIATNWVAFVWSVIHDHKVDASLGYYICPQVVVLLGVIFLGERLTKLQWTAVGIVVFGVSYMAQSTTGMVWISLVIAASFGCYALCKKKASLSALGGLTFETGFLTIPAILFLTWRVSTGTPLFADVWWKNALLVGSGLATITPLALYAEALKHIPLSTVGFLQFIGPTIQFVLGVFVFNEPFDLVRLIGFTIVWSGVVLFLYTKRPIKKPLGEQSE